MKVWYIFLLILVFYDKLFVNSRRNPVIAIYANTNPDDSETYFSDKVNVNYVRWLESAGGETIVIHTWSTNKEIDEILSKANGVLFQGGGRNTNVNMPWEKKAAYILKKVIELNRSGINYIPLWATCQGFEILHTIIAGDNSVLTKFNSWNMISSISNIQESRMFSYFSEKELKMLTDEKLAAQFHFYGVSPEMYKWRPELMSLFKITSYGADRDGKIYISTIEARDVSLPIFSVQFHPEKTPFDRNVNDEIPQSTEAVIISQRFAHFFISESMKSKAIMSEEDKLKYDYINTYENKLVFENGYYIYNKKKSSFLD
jgi:gamma-glutamyl-gamma-aminobutyrate hydrolase PuuD